MSVLVDFLPQSARERRHRVRRRRGWPLLAFSVLIATVTTDLVFRYRIVRLSAMVDEQQRTTDQRRTEIELLEDGVAGQRERLARLTDPMGRPGMSAVLDALAASRPESIRFHELSCRIDPWSDPPVPELRLDASVTEIDAMSSFLAMLQRSAVLPKMEFQQTVARQPDGRQRFRLEGARPDAR